MKRQYFLLVTCFFLLSGCYESDFNFKTLVKSDGSIHRETKIDGRGADRFQAPAGAGWKVKTYETRGGQSLIEDKYYHIYAAGDFQSADQIGSDFQFNSAKAFENISDESRKNFIELGLVEPFEESIYSKNHVQIIKKRQFLKTIFEYQEIFQNKGITELLLNDLKKEVVRQGGTPVLKTFEASVLKQPAPVVVPSEPAAAAKTPAEPADMTQKTAELTVPSPEKAIEAAPVPSVTIEGQLLAPQKVEAIAKEAMTKEILPQFKFHSEVTLPGKLVSSNAARLVGNTAVWDFTGADFENLSRYVLRAQSELIEWKPVALIGVLVFLVLFGISSAMTKVQKKKKSTGK